MEIPKLIAHRGAKSLAPENTMMAFSQAVKNGINWIELDVQLSTDGEVFIFHDDDMERLAGVKGQVTNLSIQEIRALDVGSWFDPKFKGAQIPTFDEYITWMRKNPKVFTDIEIKCKPDPDVIYETTLAKQVIAKLEKYPELFSRILIASFSLDALKEVRRNSEDVPLAMNVHIIDWKAERDVFIQKKVSTFLELNCAALVINDDQISQRRINLIKKFCNRILCYSLTEFSYERAYELFRWGANSLFVDDVTILNNRQLPTRPRVGLLATGTELTQGDVTNTNSPQIASELYSSGIPVGTHIISNDSQYEMHKNLEVLLSEHDVVITIAGLGPTEDDMTRNVIAEVVNVPLMFHEESWQRIIDYLAPRFGRENIPENNRRQAFFPEGSTILPNALGTADGCYIQFHDRDNQLKHIFMLPGPPKECIQMFNNQILQEIKKILEPTEILNYKWLVMGVSESGVAMEINNAISEFNETFSYRAVYPYIELKYHCDAQKKKRKQIVKSIESSIKPYLVSANGTTASEQLISHLMTGLFEINIKDDATHDAFRCHIINPDTLVRMNVGNKRYKLSITITGLQKYWLGQQNVNDTLSLHLTIEDCLLEKKHKRKVITLVYVKNTMAIEFAKEWLCWQINKMIKKRCDIDE